MERSLAVVTMTTTSYEAGGNTCHSKGASHTNTDILKGLPPPCRYLGLQVGYKLMGIWLLLVLAWKEKNIKEYTLDKRQALL